MTQFKINPFKMNIYPSKVLMYILSTQRYDEKGEKIYDTAFIEYGDDQYSRTGFAPMSKQDIYDYNIKNGIHPSVAEAINSCSIFRSWSTYPDQIMFYYQALEKENIKDVYPEHMRLLIAQHEHGKVVEYAVHLYDKEIITKEAMDITLRRFFGIDEGQYQNEETLLNEKYSDTYPAS